MDTQLANIDLAIIGGFLLIVTLVGFAMSKMASENVDEYFLGGNKIPWWVLGISTSTSNFDMAGTMVIAGVVFSLGYKGFLVELRGGVGLTLAFLVVFLAKWLRRSRVMTSAEWMKLRFGTGHQGKTAHILSAAANILMSLGMIVFFSKGAGKFLSYYLPYSELTCMSVMVGIGLMYTLLSGLYGVVFTDVIQMLLMAFTAVYITVEAFALAPDIAMPVGFLDLDLATPIGGNALEALVAKDPSNWEPIISMFALCVGMWVFRTFLEGMGGVGGYTDQRFFAARNEREASLLTMEAIILSILRWTMVAGLVVMGLHIVQHGLPGAVQISDDPENVLPVVLGQSLPDGVRGLVIAGLIAAAMSTFDSTLNAGASYFVKDIYQDYIKPDATAKNLMDMSRYATFGLCVAGVGLAMLVTNINEIWQLITMGLGAGLFVPLALRWYWPRFNGYGFAAGTATGAGAALIFSAILKWPLYTSFPTIVGLSFTAAVVVALMSEKTSDDTLMHFWHQINPWGLWRRYAKQAAEAGLVDDASVRTRTMERVNDGISLVLTIPFQLCMLLGAMAFVFHDWTKFAYFAIMSTFCGTGLYFFWFKNLKPVPQCEEEDAYYAEQKHLKKVTSKK